MENSLSDASNATETNEDKNNRNGGKSISPFLFPRAFKASKDVRHLNVVDVVS
jgi:hypothetical protein